MTGDLKAQAWTLCRSGRLRASRLPKNSPPPPPPPPPSPSPPPPPLLLPLKLTYKYGRLDYWRRPIEMARQPVARDARRRASSIAQIASGRRYRLAR